MEHDADGEENRSSPCDKQPADVQTKGRRGAITGICGYLFHELVEGCSSNNESEDAQACADPDQPTRFGSCGRHRLKEAFAFLPDVADVLIACHVADGSGALTVDLILSLDVLITLPGPLNRQGRRGLRSGGRILLLKPCSTKGNNIARAQNHPPGCRAPVYGGSGAGAQILDGHAPITADCQ
jgi:hypothetical protein